MNHSISKNKLVLFIAMMIALQNAAGFRASDAKGQSAAPLVEPSARYGHTMTTISNTVYLFGGTNTLPASPRAPSGDLLNDLWNYNFEPNNWTEVHPSGNVPPARHSHAATAYNGLLYLFGGTDGTSVFDDMWAYDPAANTWVHKDWTGPYNAPRVYENTMTAVGDYLYLYGGRRPGGYASTYFYRYDPSTGYADSPGIPDPGVRAGHLAINVGGKLYLFGGYGGEPPVARNDLFRFDPQTNQWLQLNPQGNLPPARDLSAIVSTAVSGNTFYIFAGRDKEGHELSDVWSYNTDTNRWTQEYPTLPGNRAYPAAASLNSTAGNSPARAIAANTFLIFGGLSGGAPIASSLIYTATSSSALYLPLVLR